jgi:hypothetical protein
VEHGIVSIARSIYMSKIDMTLKSFKPSVRKTLSILCVLGLVSGSVPLWADPTDTSQPPVAEEEDQQATQPAAQAPTMSPEELETLVAPIALYPDELLSQILVASTYPLEVVQANQWVQQHPELQGQALTQAAAQQNWDPSVQALVPFPDVLKRLNADVTWTTNLGNAFLANQNSVMDAVQRMRVKAQDAGKLTSTPQETVTATVQSGQKVVVIEPADPQVIYVPVYDPVWIWGSPAYYYYPAWYYPPPPPLGVWFVWGAGFSMVSIYPVWHGWHAWGWRPGWYDHRVVINNTFIVENHFSPVHVVRVGGVAVWAHDPVHRMGVPYPNRALVARYHPVVQPRPILTASAVAERMGNRRIVAAPQGRSAFAGSGLGAAAQAHSIRGRASLSHVQPAARGRVAGHATYGGNERGGLQRGGGH